ncbi:MAG TPA: VTT domain-containing protein, partial [Patescibacteria group bacterium]|nr:VTT domain-containing protein [Patescibacteria group bacterium]
LMCGVAVLVALGFSRLVLCIVAGMALGFWPGLLWAQLGTLVGNYVLFILTRALGREWAERLIGDRPAFRTVVQQRGAVGVILARQLPVPGFFVNLACALLPIRHLDFLIGTAIGQLPQAIPVTLIGAGVLQASLTRSISLITLAIAAAVLAGLCLRYFLNRTARQVSAHTQETDEINPTRRITKP